MSVQSSDSVPRQFAANWYDGVRLRFTCQKPQLYFEYITTDEWDEHSNRPRTVNQRILGRSKPIQSAGGSEWLIERQPNAIKFFSNQEISLVLNEQAKDADNRLSHYLTLKKSKRLGVKIAFYWQIDDRSLFTRLTTAVLQGNSIFFQLHFKDTDDIFEHLVREQATPSYETTHLLLHRVCVSL